MTLKKNLCNDRPENTPVNEMKPNAVESMKILIDFKYKIHNLTLDISKDARRSCKDGDDIILDKCMNSLCQFVNLDKQLFSFRTSITEINKILFKEGTETIICSNNVLDNHISKLIVSIFDELKLQSIDDLQRICYFWLCSIISEFDQFIYENIIFHKSLKEKIETLSKSSVKVSSTHAHITDEFDYVDASSLLIPFSEEEKKYIKKLHYFRRKIFFLSEMDISELSEENKDIFLNNEFLYINYFEKIDNIFFYIFLDSKEAYGHLWDYVEFDLIKFQKLVHFFKSQFAKSFKNQKSILQKYVHHLKPYYDKIKQG